MMSSIFATLLKHFQVEAKFPIQNSDIPEDVIKFIAKQLNKSFDLINRYRWKGRTFIYHKIQIMEFNFVANIPGKWRFFLSFWGIWSTRG